MFCFWVLNSPFSHSQANNDSSRFTVRKLIQYNDSIKNYNFTFQEESQGLYWGYLPYEGKYMAIKPKIYNNSNDTIFVKSLELKDKTVSWDGRFNVSVAPNSYYEVRGVWWSRHRLGRFSCPIVIHYTIGENSKILKIQTWGTIQPFEWVNGEKVNQWNGSVNSGKYGRWYYFAENGGINKVVYYVNNEPHIIYEDLHGFTQTSDDYPRMFDTIPFVTQYFYKTQLKQKEIFIDGKVNEYYKNGQLKSIQYKTVAFDTIPLSTYFYESGNIKGKNYSDSSIWFYESGIAQSYRKNNISKFFYETGELMRYNQIVNESNDTIPKLIELHKNGCIKTENYNKDHIIHFSENQCGCPIFEIFGGRDTTFYDQCVPNKRRYPIPAFDSQRWGYCIDVGQFKDHHLVQGSSTYYIRGGEIQFTLTKSNNEFFEPFEYNGTNYNQYLDGRKNGLWIYKSKNDSITKFVVYLSNNPYLNIYDFPHKIYANGNLIESIYYYPNGFLSAKVFESQQGHNIVLGYSKSDSGMVVSGKRNEDDLIYENGVLTKVVSPKTKGFERTGVEHDIRIEIKDIPYYIEEGKFKDYDLYNGTITYFNENGVKIKTVKVVNGIKK